MINDSKCSELFQTPPIEFVYFLENLTCLLLFVIAAKTANQTHQHRTQTSTFGSATPNFMLSFVSHTEGSALSARQGENSLKRASKTHHNPLGAMLVLFEKFRQERALGMFGEYVNQSIYKGTLLYLSYFSLETNKDLLSVLIYVLCLLRNCQGR